MRLVFSLLFALFSMSQLGATEIYQAYYDQDDQVLLLDVGYNDCVDRGFALNRSDACQESYPAVCWAYLEAALSGVRCGEDSITYHYETLRFPLSSAEGPYWLNIYDETSSSRYTQVSAFVADANWAAPVLPGSVQ